MLYIKKNFRTFSNINISKENPQKISDAEFYVNLRKNLKMKSNDINKFSDNLYLKKHIPQKIYNIVNDIQDIKNNIKNILDIGTENVFFFGFIKRKNRS